MALWTVMFASLSMVALEGLAGHVFGSAGLMAQAVALAPSIGCCIVALFADLARPSLSSLISVLRVSFMLPLGFLVLVIAGGNFSDGVAPQAGMTAAISFVALVTGLVSLGFLERFQSNDRFVYAAVIGIRQAAFGNAALILAAASVHAFGSAIPDLVVATLMALLLIEGAAATIPQVLAGLR